LVDEIKDCYGAIGVIHSAWTPMPGRFKDYIAVPKLNGYQSLHTTVVGPNGNPLELQIRTFEMHRTAELGIAAHFAYKDDRRKGKAKARAEDWLRSLAEWEAQSGDEPSSFMEELRVDLTAGEVFVFTPKGEVMGLAAGATPLDFAYAVHTDVGHRCVGAKVNGRIVPLTYTLESGDRVEVLTSNQPDKGPSRDWMNVAMTNRARSKIRQWFAKEKREDWEQRGRESLTQALKKQSIPHARIQNSSILASIIRDMGFKKAEDFYIALGSQKFSPNVVVNKMLQELKTDEAIPDDEALPGIPSQRSKLAKPGDDFGIRVEGIQNTSTVAIRMAKCCMPVPGDRIKGYISLGKGITIHREDCPNTKALMKNPERFTPVTWDGDAHTSFRVEIQVEGWDRVRLLEDISRTIAEHGANIVQHQGVVIDQLVKERFTVELGDVGTLRSMLTALRNIESVFDAYRVTPS
jgi:GTP pyrophosphokinase